jgi:hypothetical protein
LPVSGALAKSIREVGICHPNGRFDAAILFHRLWSTSIPAPADDFRDRAGTSPITGAPQAIASSSGAIRAFVPRRIDERAAPA